MSRILIICAALIGQGCTPQDTWNQFRGDVGNGGQKFVATFPPVMIRNHQVDLSAKQITSSPVVSPNGNVIVSTYQRFTSGHSEGVLHILSSGNQPISTATATSSGQFSTAAVDHEDYVYVVLDPPGNGDKTLIKFNSEGKVQWYRALQNSGRDLTPPKLIRHADQSLIFVRNGLKLSVFNDSGDLLTSDWVCAILDGGGDPGFHFRVRPLVLPPPYYEGPVAGFVAFKGESPANSVFMAIPVNNCGIFFYRIQLGATASVPPKFILAKDFHEESLFYGPAAVAGDGMTLVPGSDGELTAFNIRTGKEIWNRFLTDPNSRIAVAFLPLAVNYAYVVTRDKLRKIDLNNQGSDVASVSIENGYDVVVSTTYVHVIAAGGVKTFDLDLNPVPISSVQLELEQRQPAIGPLGQVYIAGKNAVLHVFRSQP